MTGIAAGPRARPSPLARVRRKPDRARYDAAAVHAVLDAAPFCHVALRDTGLWRVAIEHASVKARSGSTIDPPADLAWPVWAGHVPAGLAFGRPAAAEGLPDGITDAAPGTRVNPAFSRRPG
jgi:hypothetical protein